MGQKTSQCALRKGPKLGYDWDSIFFAKKDYSLLLKRDVTIRHLVFNFCASAQVGKVVITSTVHHKIVVNIFVRKPGVIVGKTGNELEKLKCAILKAVGESVFINVHEIKRSASDPVIIANGIASQLKKRASFRKSMKVAIQLFMKQPGAKGIKIMCSGRLGGAEMARRERYTVGNMPLHNLNVEIKYGFATAVTIYGVIGIQVWVCFNSQSDRFIVN